MEKIKNKIKDIYGSDKKTKYVTEKELQKYGLTGITLRSYQLDGVNWLIERYQREHGCILGDEMGLGKTCQTISFLVYLYGSGDSKGPFLILSPLSVLANWKNELARFAPNLDVIRYVGNVEHREGPLRKQIRKRKDKLCVLLTTYEIFLKDQSYLKRKSWHTLVVDEAHRLKNRQSLLHQTLLTFDMQHRILLTGTPVQNNLKELYSLLCFVAPDVFNEDYIDSFLETFDDVQNTNDASALHKILKPFLLRRVKSEVVKDLPKKTELVLCHGMSALQKKYYKAILTKDVSVFESGSAASKTRLMNILMQLRKCVNHPYLFDGVEPEPFQLGEHLIEASGKLVLIDQLLGYLRAKGHKVLLFSQMTRMLDVLQDYLGYRGYTYERLDGSVRGEERYLAVQNFNDDDETFIFLLSTKAGGVGLNLVGADTVIFVDSDFNPQNDLQAAARAHRIGQTRPVKVIRLIGRSTVDEIILRRAEAKLKLTEAVIEGGQFSLEPQKKEELIADNEVKLQDIVKFGFDKLFATDESTIEDVDFDSLLGKSVDGAWTEDEEAIQAQATLAAASMEIDEEEDKEDANMYMFEGTDYSKAPSTADIDAFAELIEAHRVVAEEACSSETGRPLRRTKTTLLPGMVSEPSMCTPLTDEEKEKRRQKREEVAAKRQKDAEQEKLRRAEAQKKRRAALWKEHNYTSCNLALDSGGESEGEEPNITLSDEEDDESSTGSNNHRQIHYLVGDVTQPQHVDGKHAFIVHCVDDSGSWGAGGLFSAISRRSDDPEQHYELAGKMKDVNLGDTHLVAFDTALGREQGDDYVALIIAQQRDRKGNLSGIKLSALNQGLKRLCKGAMEMKDGNATDDAPSTSAAAAKRPSSMSREHTLSTSSTSDTESKPKITSMRRISSSARSDSASPVLPTFMCGVKCYFHKLSADVAKRLKRYLVAYDGDVHKTVNDETNYIVIDQPDTTQPFDMEPDLLKSKEPAGGRCVVHYDWLDDCFKTKLKTDHSKWKITPS